MQHATASGATQNVPASPTNTAAIAKVGTAGTSHSISMRIVRQYDINNDKFPARIDVYYGYLPMRPQLACRLANN